LESIRATAPQGRTIETMKTIEELRTVFRYDPETGFIHWLNKPIGRMSVNGKAECLDKDGYVSVGHGKKRYRTHRLAWALQTGNWPTKGLDHINGNRTDNRWTNLREANDRQNQQNSKLRSDNTIGHKGIYWYRPRSSWRVKIRDGTGREIIKYRKNLEEAIKLAAKLRETHHGEFARHA
jgi:hypothetical protein